MLFAWITALIATGGSLYMSEVLGFIPCKLCWIQRIFMYPLVAFLGVALLRRENGVYQYVLPLSVPGGLTSLYHYLKQKLPALQAVTSSCGRDPCTTDYLDWFGVITIPFLALIAFTLITIFMVLLYRMDKRRSLNDAQKGTVSTGLGRDCI